MGRILDLCAEIATEAEEGEDGLDLSPDAWDRFRQDWNDEDIEDAMAIVKDSLLRSELAERAAGAEYFDLRFRNRIYAKQPESALPVAGSALLATGR